MATLIKNKEVVSNDPWHVIANDAPVTDFSIVSLPRWQAERETLLPLAQARKLGIWLDSIETVDLIENDYSHFAVIALNFPVFTDGRAYSGARLLRERYFYKGEIRAIGDVLIDQLYLMNRIGFDALALRDDQDIELALRSFAPFSFTYQSDVLETRPLWRRRPASGVETEQKEALPA